MPEADLARVPDEEVQAHADDRVQPGEDRDVVEIVVGQDERAHRDDRREGGEPSGAGRGEPRSHRRAYTRSAAATPAMPPGLTNSTPRRITNAITSLYADDT